MKNEEIVAGLCVYCCAVCCVVSMNNILTSNTAKSMNSPWNIYSCSWTGTGTGNCKVTYFGRRNEAANCVELAEFTGSVRLAELVELAARLAELAGFAGAGGCVEVAEFAGVGLGRLAELVEFVTRLAGAAGCIKQAEFAGTGAVRFAELAK